MNLSRAFAESVRKRPGNTALYWGAAEFTYGQLWQQAVFVSTQLVQTYGVKPGDRVALWLKNRPEFIPALFGILNAGAVVVPINNFLKADEVSYILRDAGVDVMVTDAELGTHHRPLEAARPGLRLLKVETIPMDLHAGASAAGPDSSSIPGANRAASDLAVLIYTSGTTGHPKGAMLSHANLLHNVDSCRRVLQTVEADCFAVMLPMFHSYVLTVGLLLPLLVGGRIVLVKSLHPIRAAMEELFQRGTTTLPAIPQFYRSLVNAPVSSLHTIRVCISGAAPLPGQVLREFEEKFRIPLIEGYGLSEASPVVTKNPLDHTRKAGSIGLPIPDVEVSIQDDTGQQLGPREIGEVCVRGGNVMLGYWNQPAETAKAMRGDWLLTGDIGYRDEDGYYYITDRKKDMLLVNGINVYPREVEEVLHQYPGVKDAAVIGRVDSRKGEHPVAFITAQEGAVLNETDILHFVRRKLADYKVPRKITFLPEMPRNATGKILKTALRSMPDH